MFEHDFSSFFKDRFLNYLVVEEQTGIIKHLTHLEELILTKQEQGLSIAASFINELVKVFEGNVDTKIFTTVKYDGAPAVIAGYNPENSKFFVATKSIEAKNSKINYTDQDIDLNHGHAPGLVKKLKLALRYLPAVIKQNIYQGDFMYDRADLKQINHEGEQLVIFKPNTITYAVDASSELGKKILNSQIGIIFHTRYTGPSLQQLSKSPDVSVSEFNQTPEVFIDDAKFKDVSGTATLTEEEKSLIDNNLEQITSASKTVKWTDLPNKLYEDLNTYINTLIRDGRFITDPDKEFNNFVTWYDNRLSAPIEKLKTPAGKQRATDAKEGIMRGVNSDKMQIVNLFFITQKLEEIKKVFINKYNAAINTKQFIAQPDGTLKVTAPEGYVAVDHAGNMVKLVDRLEFSRANFLIPKGEKFK